MINGFFGTYFVNCRGEFSPSLSIDNVLNPIKSISVLKSSSEGVNDTSTKQLLDILKELTMEPVLNFAQRPRLLEVNIN